MKKVLHIIQSNPIFTIVIPFLLNKYILISLGFIIWMLFIDTNSWLIHRELDHEIRELQNNKIYYLKEIKKDQETIKKLKDSNELEKFAREEYFMKKDNEEIYIIEHQDSIQK
ncbi:FtsB family cell division protein [Aquimarina rhabdastrellae]